MINIKLLTESTTYPPAQEISESLASTNIPKPANLKSPTTLLRMGKTFEESQHYYQAALCYVLAAKQGNIKGYHRLITVLSKNAVDSVFGDARIADVDVELCKQQQQDLLQQRIAFLQKFALLRRIKELNYLEYPSLKALFNAVDAVDTTWFRAEKLLDNYQKKLLAILPHYTNDLRKKAAACAADLATAQAQQTALEHATAAVNALKAIAAINADNCENVLISLKQAAAGITASIAHSQQTLLAEVDSVLTDVRALSAKQNKSGAIGSLLQLKLAAAPLHTSLTKLTGTLSVLKAKTQLLKPEDTDTSMVLKSYRCEFDEILADMRREQVRGLNQLQGIVDKYSHKDGSLTVTYRA